MFDISFQEKVKHYFLFSVIFAKFLTFYPKTSKGPNSQSANIAHFEAFLIDFLKKKYILLHSPPGRYGSSRSNTLIYTE